MTLTMGSCLSCLIVNMSQLVRKVRVGPKHPGNLNVLISDTRARACVCVCGVCVSTDRARFFPIDFVACRVHAQTCPPPHGLLL